MSLCAAIIVGLWQMIKTSTLPRLREQDLPGHHTTHSIAGLRLICDTLSTIA